MTTKSDEAYVHMENEGAVDKLQIDGLNDPSLSQEENDLRLAMALQQQENAASLEATRKRHEQTMAAQNNRTGRSCVSSSLSNIRKTKKAANDVVGSAGTGAYTAPGNEGQDTTSNDFDVGTAKMVEKMVKTDAALNAASKTRNARSGHAAFRK